MFAPAELAVGLTAAEAVLWDRVARPAVLFAVVGTDVAVKVATSEFKAVAARAPAVAAALGAAMPPLVACAVGMATPVGRGMSPTKASILEGNSAVAS